MVSHLCTSVVHGVRTLCAAFDDVVFPRHCLITGEYIGAAPTRLPGVSDAITDALPPGPREVEVLALLQRNFGADDLLLTSAFARYAVQVDSDADRLIYAIKYGQRTRLASALGYEVGATLRDRLESDTHSSSITNLSYDMVVPVPIHAARLRERGYNQAALIARGVARALDVLYTEPLMRTHYTGTQTTLDAQHRLANVANAFKIDNNWQGAPKGARSGSSLGARSGVSLGAMNDVRGARVLIVDDVLTTGATMNACALALLDAGARRVDAAAIAVAL